MQLDIETITYNATIAKNVHDINTTYPMEETTAWVFSTDVDPAVGETFVNGTTIAENNQWITGDRWSFAKNNLSEYFLTLAKEVLQGTIPDAEHIAFTSNQAVMIRDLAIIVEDINDPAFFGMIHDKNQEIIIVINKDMVDGEATITVLNRKVAK